MPQSCHSQPARKTLCQHGTGSLCPCLISMSCNSKLIQLTSLSGYFMLQKEPRYLQKVFRFSMILHDSPIWPTFPDTMVCGISDGINIPRPSEVSPQASSAQHRRQQRGKSMVTHRRTWWTPTVTPLRLVTSIPCITSTTSIPGLAAQWQLQRLSRGHRRGQQHPC